MGRWSQRRRRGGGGPPVTVGPTATITITLVQIEDAPGGLVKAFFSGAVDVADFSPSGFFLPNSGGEAAAVEQIDATTLRYGNDAWSGAIFEDDPWEYFDTVPYVVTPQDGLVSG